MASIAVVGGGVGGLVAAIRLRSAGHEVSLFERNGVLGGKLAQRKVDGYSFDIGPSLLTWPSVFQSLLTDAGLQLHNYIDIVRLPSQFTNHFVDGSSFTVFDDEEATAESVRLFAGNKGVAQWQAFMKRAATAWEVSERTFLTAPMESPFKLIQRMKSPRDFVTIDPFTSLARRASKSFSDPRLQMWLNRYATYSGSNPWSSPATVACIPFLEQRYGAWHVRGGLTELGAALTKACVELGVTINLSSDVTALTHNRDSLTGIQVAGKTLRFDAVVANVDSEHLYGDLLPTPVQLRRTRKAGRSTSGFALLLGLKGKSGTAHHSVFFSRDQRLEFDEINSSVAEHPTIYVCNSSATEPSEAPADGENWFVLVNVAAGSAIDWKSYGEKIIDRLGVRDRLQVSEYLTPKTFAERYRAPGGAIYGTSSNSKQAAFLRSSNRGPIRGLYVAGGSAHPGGGLPLVAQSGRIAADLLIKDCK